MIKTKIEFKQIEGGYIANKMAVAGLDDWYLACSIVNSGRNLTALMTREVKVTKENLGELILADFKCEVGSIRCEEHNRLGTMLDNEKAQDFILDTAKRYKIKEELARQLLILNLFEITWAHDKEEL